MTDHLPECRVNREFTPIKSADLWVSASCICDMLSACEQRVLNSVRVDERKRAVFIAQHSIEDSYAREDAIAWINGETPKWWTGNQP